MLFAIKHTAVMSRLLVRASLLKDVGADFRISFGKPSSNKVLGHLNDTAQAVCKLSTYVLHKVSPCLPLETNHRAASLISCFA